MSLIPIQEVTQVTLNSMPSRNQGREAGAALSSDGDWLSSSFVQVLSTIIN